jgi:hypothetical protein
MRQEPLLMRKCPTTLMFNKFYSIPVTLIKNIFLCCVCSSKSKEKDNVEFRILVTD